MEKSESEWAVVRNEGHEYERKLEYRWKLECESISK